MEAGDSGGVSPGRLRSTMPLGSWCDAERYRDDRRIATSGICGEMTMMNAPMVLLPIPSMSL